MPSTKRYTPVERPPINRVALAAMASNTGCTSDGEEAITFRMSAVAVCRSRASLVSARARRSSLSSRSIPGFDFADLDFWTVDTGRLSFVDLDVAALGAFDFGVGIALVRRGADARFAAFRP